MNPPILIIDDSLTVRMDLKDAFASAGFESIQCADLDSARRTLQQERIGLVILDILLPDGDGLDFLWELRNTPVIADTPVLLLSSEAEVRDRVRGLVGGANAYIGKPYNRNNVIDIAQKLLRQRDDPCARPMVLVIDDSATFRQAMIEALEANGYSARGAESGEDGLRQALQRPPDAVLVDGLLPGIDGVAVIQRIRSDPSLRHIPSLLLTESVGKESEIRALEAGADAYVRKGEGTDVVLTRLAAVLRSAVAPASFEVQRSMAGATRILAVDDSPTFLDVLTLELQKEMYEVIQARSGAEALDKLQDEHIDCILLDLVMAGMTGEEACRQIKATPRFFHIPVIILTARQDQESLLSCLKAGADDYIPKSSEFDVLKGRLRAQLRRKQFEGENRLIQEVIATVRKSEARFRSAFDDTNVAMVLTDIDNRFVRVNAAFARLFDYTQEEMIGMAMADITHPDDLAESYARRKQLLANKSDFFEMEKRYRRRDGGMFWGLTNVSLIRSPDGQPQQYVGQVQDITEKKRVAEENRRYNERLKFLRRIDQALAAGDNPESIAEAALPLLRELLGVHRAVVNLFDLEKGEVEWLGAAGRKRVRVGPGVRFSLQFMGDLAALARGEVQHIDVVRLPPGPEVDALRASGVESYAVAPMIADGELIGGVSIGGSKENITDDQIAIAQEVATQFAIAIRRARMDLDLQAKNEELRETSQQLWQTAKLATMGELAASVAHELNNPLATVCLGIEDLLSQFAPESSSYKELKVMEQEVERMASLVSNLLQFSRPGHQHNSTFDVAEEIDRTLEITLHFLRKRKVVIQRDYAADLPLIFGDRQKLHQVFINLLVNASDAMPGGGSITIRTRRGLGSNESRAVAIEFIDTGSGIPAEILSRITEPFFTTKAEGKGTGLGLAICKRMVNDHRGELEITSKLGEGTTVRIILPVQNGVNIQHLVND